MEQPVFKRVLLKISGEALAGDKHFGLDFQVMGRVADVIKQCVDMGVQVGIVIGGGNFWRGVKDGEGHIERTRADHMGMMATVMNSLALADVLEQMDVDVRVETAIEMRAIAEPYIRLRAMRHLGKGRVVIFGCGTGSPDRRAGCIRRPHRGNANTVRRFVHRNQREQKHLLLAVNGRRRHRRKHQRPKIHPRTFLPEGVI